MTVEQELPQHLPAERAGPTKAATSEFSKAPVDDGAPIDPDYGWVEGRSVQQQWLEYVLMCLCNVAWTIDASILPIFFGEFQRLFHVSQTSLGWLSTAKGWTAALVAFPCGFMGELLPRPLLVGLGMIFWSTGLLLCAMASSFEMLFLGRVLNGAGLGIVQPLLLSLVADKNAPTKRGSAFGSIYFVGAVANTIFAFVATTFAATELGGVAGWRVSVAVVALFSGSVGLAFLLLVGEPNAPFLAERRQRQGFLSVFRENMPKVIQLFKYPTFVLILCQGAPGTAPWTVFVYFTQWLELSCFSHIQSAAIWSAFGWGCACSNLLSGGLLNFVARRFPDHGPPSIANFSVAIGIPFLLLIFYILPGPMAEGEGSNLVPAYIPFLLLIFYILPGPMAEGEGSNLVPAYILTFLSFGVGAAMCGTINKKVFADIVPASVFTYVFAIDQLIEQGIGNFAGLAVGILTDKVFHYDREAAEAGHCAPEEADKLGMGMFVVCMVAWAICFSVYLGMHYTYPRDRRLQLLLRRADALRKESDQWDSGCSESTAEPSLEVASQQPASA